MAAAISNRPFRYSQCPLNVPCLQGRCWDSRGSLCIRSKVPGKIRHVICSREIKRHVKRRRVVVVAMQADDVPSDMTLETALGLLGVQEGATFDDILRAKKKKLDKMEGDQEQLMQVEAAYDILLMQSLSKRRAGKVADKSVRFADVKKIQPASTPKWLQRVQGAVRVTPVSVDVPASSDLAKQAAVFGALAAWTLLGSSGEVQPTSSGADVPGLQLALGFGASIYFLRQQKVKLGKASLLTVGGVVGGALLGTVVENYLRVDIFPVLGVSSPAVVVSEFAFLALWACSGYLR